MDEVAGPVLPFTEKEFEDLVMRYKDTYVADKARTKLKHISDLQYGKQSPSGVGIFFSEVNESGICSGSKVEDGRVFLHAHTLTRPAPTSFLYGKGQVLGTFSYIPERQYKRTFYSRNIVRNVLANFNRKHSTGTEEAYAIFYPHYCLSILTALWEMKRYKQPAALIDSNFSVACSKKHPFLYLFYKAKVVGSIYPERNTVTPTSNLQEEIQDLIVQDQPRERFRLQVGMLNDF